MPNIENSREMQDLARRREKDVQLARVIQQKMLPKKLSSRHWDIDYRFVPAEEVSGDIIDFYNFSDVFFDEEEDNPEYLGLVLFDASGHGVAAGLITVLARPLSFRVHREMKNFPLKESVFQANADLIREIGNTGYYLTGGFPMIPAFWASGI